jgi:hypothetical protein
VGTSFAHAATATTQCESDVFAFNDAVELSGGCVQLWISIHGFEILYDPADDTNFAREAHNLMYVSASEFVKARKHRAQEICDTTQGDMSVDDCTSSDDGGTSTSSDEDGPFVFTELDGEHKECNGECCSSRRFKTYFPRCLVSLRPVETVDIQKVRESAFFAQTHLELELDNSLIRNLLYYFYYTTYFQLARESTGDVEEGGRSELPACLVAAIRRAYPNEDGVPYEGFKQYSEKWQFSL